jgi:hypothetical protein
VVLVLFFSLFMTETDTPTCKRCGSAMLPWRHSAAWQAFTCWACFAVVLEKIEDQRGSQERQQELQHERQHELQEVRIRNEAADDQAGGPVLRVSGVPLRGD